MEKAWPMMIRYVEIPVNATAKVFIPVKPESIVAENRIEVSKVKDIKVQSEKDGWMLCQVGSGSYSFTVK